ncbi:WD40 repeat domain-containing protein [Actinoplanes sp. L3-i22]|uniref:WD40 repeat domain-containing protein n=1 Tax=Actinoplanes sp. L3-i22 TaxID=2836373 RepID=UPI001C77089A|nr:WD40 repeat domain-containing protein [Actinoplanes sp. L3-i22]BCY08708.1 hypothetical protein L3i22_037960 [Actinoplanes sp. L3-i22]
MIIGGEALRPWWPMALVTDACGPPVLVAGTTDNGPIAAWDVSTGKLLSQHPELTTAGLNGLTAGRLSDGRLVAAACGDGWIERWDIATGQPLAHADDFGSDQYWSLAMHGRLLAAAGQCGRGAISRWDILTGEPSAQLGPGAGHDGIVHNLVMATSRAGSPILISSDESGRIVRSDAVTGVPIGESLFVESDGGRIPLATVPYRNGHLLIAASHTSGVTRWDLWSGEPIGQPLPGPSDMVDVAAYLPGGRPVILLSCQADLVYRWDALTGTPLGAPEPGTTLAASENIVVIGSDTRDCRVETTAPPPPATSGSPATTQHIGQNPPQ